MHGSRWSPAPGLHGLPSRVSTALLIASGLLGWMGWASADGHRAPGLVEDPLPYVDPRIGSSNGGNTFPGAVLPFGMLAWSPENTRGNATRTAAPGGYQYEARKIRGFSLTHLSGTGCAGASGDVPFMPIMGGVKSSPSADREDRVYASRFSHANETAAPGFYQVRLESGIDIELTATLRTGYGRFTFPPGETPTLLVRVSDSEVGSSEAHVEIDPDTRTVRGSVTSGNFCGYINAVDRRSYYTLYFIATFDHPFADFGTWIDDSVRVATTEASGGTSYGEEGWPVPGKGSGAYVTFTGDGVTRVGVRVGVSYVSQANALANLRRESGERSFEDIRRGAAEAWSRRLARIQVAGGSDEQRTIFYTALYHAMLHPNLFSDVNGEYRGFDGAVHRVAGGQRNQYANFSGWDVYRSQLQLVALLEPAIAGDIAQSLLNQAAENGGAWDRWTHNSGATHVMAGDPSAPAIAGIVAFGGGDFDVDGAFESLRTAATVPTALDLSNEGCPVECRGQRPSLDKWIRLHYIPTVSNSWGGAGETLEMTSADFALSQLASRLGDDRAASGLLDRSGYWRNVFNPQATPQGGYIQNRNEDGTWPPFDPASDEGFAEGSSAQYTWMIPFDARGLVDAMGGDEAAARRLDAFFHHPDGGWALTGAGPLHAEMDNEPSIGSPWLYLFCGRPDRTQETVREVLNTLWSDGPDGIPGNDDLGAMSAWYVWTAMGLYPYYPGRAELLVTAPLFPFVRIHRAMESASITISAPEANPDAAFIHALRLDGRRRAGSWLPESFVSRGGRLEFRLSSTPEPTWARRPEDRPPSFSTAAAK